MSGKAIRETVGFLAVIAGLAFVGVEMKNNTNAVQAQTYQDLMQQLNNFINTQPGGCSGLGGLDTPPGRVNTWCPVPP